MFKNWFIFSSEIHNYDIVSLSTDKFFKPFYKTDSFGKDFINVNAINYWNKMQNILGDHPLKSLNPTKIQSIFTQRFINKYQ